MQDKPSVFVGIPTRNRPGFVREAVKSVLDQDYPRLRVVVSDNCSEAEASRDVASWVRELDDPRVSYVLQQENGGEYGQGRFFEAQCEEDYFVILHDDDCLAPGHLEYALAVMQADPSLVFFSCCQTVIDEQGDEQPELTRDYNEGEGRTRFGEGRIENPLDTLLKYGGLFSISGAVFRFSRVLEHGLVDPDCGGLYPFEFNVFLRQTEPSGPAFFSTRRLVAYRHHSDTMRNYAKPFFNQTMMATMIKLLERRRFSGRTERRRRKLLASIYRNYAYIMYVAGERASCYRFLARSLRLFPLSRYGWGYAGLAVLAPFLIRPLWGPKVTLR